MYKDYFRLTEMPFSIAPDPRFLFMSDRHREALAHLLYGVQGEGGIVLLTGEVGTGKTTICRCMLEQLPENIDVAFILNPLMSVEELLQTICEEYDIADVAQRPGIKAAVDAIHARLLDGNTRGRRAILLIDEAQNLDPRVLEQLRLLTNLETNTRKLLQIILIGQPELQDLLAKPEMRQVAQRVIARYHLTQLSAAEVSAYVAHRLRVAGAAPAIFPDALVKRLVRASGGVPRLINLVCDRALLGTYVQGQQQVSVHTLRQAINEVTATKRPQGRPWAIAAGLLAIAAAAVYFAGGLPSQFLSPVTPSSPAATPGLAALAQPTAAEQPSAPADSPTPATESNPVPSAPVTAAEAEAPATQAVGSAESDAPLATGVDWPPTIQRAESEALAFQALFKLHGINADAPSKAAPCRQAEARGMRCHAARGGLSDLFLINQPVVMRLSSADGRDYSVTLAALDHQVATVLVAGIPRRLAVADLANVWSGHFVVLWKAPDGFTDPLAIGQRGPAVAWLRRSLAAIDGADDDGSNVFDAMLARRVRAFQLADGIRPDGFVGPLTAIRINVRSGLGGPALVNGKKG